MAKNWEEIKAGIDCFSSEEWDEMNLRVKLVGEIIKAREAQGVTQVELGKKTGLTQSVIARFESSKKDTQLSTIFKILAPLGLTLDIVPKKSM